MIDKLLGWLSPHMCEGCKEVGETLCKRCNFYILEHKWCKCVGCQHQITTPELTKTGNLCFGCSQILPFNKVFVVGARTGILRRLVGNYKYFSRRESSKAIAKLLENILPENLPNLVIVPLPTISKRIRERGFDHMKLVAHELARLRGWPCDLALLRRTDNVSQHSANLRQRQQQAAKAFTINPRRPVPPHILLIDDIYTTGATTTTAAKLLKKHGAQEVYLGIVARQVSQSK